MISDIQKQCQQAARRCGVGQVADVMFEWMTAQNRLKTHENRLRVGLCILNIFRAS